MQFFCRPEFPFVHEAEQVFLYPGAGHIFEGNAGEVFLKVAFAYAFVFLVCTRFYCLLFEGEPLCNVVGEENGLQRLLLRGWRCYRRRCLRLILKRGVRQRIIARLGRAGTLGVKQEILLHFIADPRFQSIEVFGGDVEFDAVSAELDFVDTFMETVRNEPVFADEIVFEFIGHGIQLPIGKFEKTAHLFFGLSIGQDGTDGCEGSGRSRFGNGIRKQLLGIPAGYGIEKFESFHLSPEPKTENYIVQTVLCEFNDTRFRRKKIAHFLTQNRNFC